MAQTAPSTLVSPFPRLFSLPLSPLAPDCYTVPPVTLLVSVVLCPTYAPFCPAPFGPLIPCSTPSSLCLSPKPSILLIFCPWTPSMCGCYKPHWNSIEKTLLSSLSALLASCGCVDLVCARVLDCLPLKVLFRKVAALYHQVHTTIKNCMWSQRHGQQPAEWWAEHTAWLHQLPWQQHELKMKILHVCEPMP